MCAIASRIGAGQPDLHLSISNRLGPKTTRGKGRGGDGQTKSIAPEATKDGGGDICLQPLTGFNRGSSHVEFDLRTMNTRAPQGNHTLNRTRTYFFVDHSGTIAQAWSVGEPYF